MSTRAWRPRGWAGDAGKSWFPREGAPAPPHPRVLPPFLDLPKARAEGDVTSKTGSRGVRSLRAARAWRGVETGMREMEGRRDGESERERWARPLFLFGAVNTAPSGSAAAHRVTLLAPLKVFVPTAAWYASFLSFSLGAGRGGGPRLVEEGGRCGVYLSGSLGLFSPFSSVAL